MAYAVGTLKLTKPLPPAVVQKAAEEIKKILTPISMFAGGQFSSGDALQAVIKDDSIALNFEPPFFGQTVEAFYQPVMDENGKPKMQNGIPDAIKITAVESAAKIYIIQGIREAFKGTEHQINDYMSQQDLAMANRSGGRS